MREALRKADQSARFAEKLQLRSRDHGFNATEEARVLVIGRTLPELTVQVAARQLQPQAQALGGGSLRVDPDEAGPHGSH